MWKMLFFIWAVPLALAAVGITRAANGTRIITPKELQFLFGSARRGRLSLWFWIAMIVLAIGFFTLGVVEAVVLLNLRAGWAILGALFTGAMATAVLLLVMRSRFSYRGEPQKARHSARGRVAYSRDF